MPKAAIDEHRDLALAKNEVSLAAKARQRPTVDSIAEAALVNRGAQGYLGRGVF